MKTTTSILSMRTTPLVDARGIFGARHDVRVLVFGERIDVPVIQTTAGTTTLIPRKAATGRTVRRDSRLYAAAVTSAIGAANHSAAAGRACVDDGTGTCAICAVALVTCDACAGRGYHAAACAELEPAEVTP